MEILYYNDLTALNLKIELTVLVDYCGFNLPYYAVVTSICGDDINSSVMKKNVPVSQKSKTEEI